MNKQLISLKAILFGMQLLLLLGCGSRVLQMPRNSQLEAASTPVFTFLRYEVYGSGCNKKNTVLTFDKKKATFLAEYTNHFAEVSPSDLVSLKKDACSLVIYYTMEENWQFSIFSTRFRGYLFLDPKTQATHNVKIWFSGFNSDKTFIKTFSNTSKKTMRQEIDHSIDLQTGEKAWSPCDGNKHFLIYSTLIAQNDNLGGSAGIGIDSATGKLMNLEEYQVVTRECP